jgi:hypothetical protein
MAFGNKTGRSITERVALPVIFIISLLAAWLVVQLRTVIRMSGPVELSRSGLSASVPSGNGWECEGKWVYDNDGFTLTSVLGAGDGTTPAARRRTGPSVLLGVRRSFARCRYLLAAAKVTMQQRLDRLRTEGETIETGQTAAGKLIVDWARIKTSEGPVIYFGVCGLPAGRQLEIEVFQTAEEQGLAQNVFERIVKNIRFSDNGLLQAGVEVVSEARKMGLSDIAAEEQPVFFVITDTRKKAIGFTMDAITVVDTDANAAVRAGSYYYVRGTILNERVGLFRGDAAFDRFVWQVESRTGAASRGIEMTVDNSVLQVRKSGGGALEGEYILGEAAVPDIVIEAVLRRMLDADRSAIVVDLIGPEGIITPVYVEKINSGEQQGDSASSPQAQGGTLRVELLDGRGYWQQIYYDSSKEPIKTVLSQESQYTLNRADANQISKLFPERANLVRDKSRLLGGDKL